MLAAEHVLVSGGGGNTYNYKSQWEVYNGHPGQPADVLILLDADHRPDPISQSGALKYLLIDVLMRILEPSISFAVFFPDSVSRSS